MEKKTQWFEVWFDSPYYPILYKKRNTAEAQSFIDKITDFLQIEKGSKVLDLACGRGRHSYYLSQKGLDVTGLDISPKSIQTAQTRYQSENVEFYIHDMRLPFRINYYDFVFNFFTSLGYFDQIKENQHVFSAVHKGLKKGGKLLVDFMNVEKVMANLVEREEVEIDGISFYIRREIEDDKIMKHIRVTDGNKIAMYSEAVQILKPHHFYSFLHEEGFKLLDEFGNYALEDFNPSDSDRYIFLAQKI